MTPEQALAALLSYFSKSKLSPAQQAIYLAKLRTLNTEQLSRTCEIAIDRHKYKTIPSVAELLAWGQGKEPGKARSREERGVWPDMERRRQAAYAKALSEATPDDRCALVERNHARFEAHRRDLGVPVLQSHFTRCTCTRENHPHTLDGALAKYGLDYRGEPINPQHRKPWEEVLA